ncbi:hypothetical protein ABEU86_22210 [Pseudomonas paraversuta]|uniref:hypothetical protein n=1 Tax=Pseudomonas paraversuta TaxID=2750624 RepID=UPI003D2A4E72
MTGSNETMADALELLLLNQHAIAAGLEEVALWIEARGSLDTHDNITTALGTLDLNADAITTTIEKLRQNHQQLKTRSPDAKNPTEVGPIAVYF